MYLKSTFLNEGKIYINAASGTHFFKRNFSVHRNILSGFGREFGWQLSLSHARKSQFWVQQSAVALYSSGTVYWHAGKEY
jgi:hypothetical protein